MNGMRINPCLYPRQIQHRRCRASALTFAAEARTSIPAALITGSATGIGKSTALHLSSKGWQVFAGVLSESEGKALLRDAPSVVPVVLDVTSDESTAAALEEVTRHLGDGRNLSGLVNNAGTGVILPLELTPMEDFDRVLAVNLSGVVRITKAALPLLKKRAPGQRPGRIVNIGSHAGTIAIPLAAAYAASKFGLEALSDVMRYELGSKWGIRTVLIKAGGVRTPLWEATRARTAAALAAADPAAALLYKDMFDGVLEVARAAEAGGIEAAELAALVEEALTVPRPRSRYLVDGKAAFEMTLRRLLPDWLWDGVLLSNIAAAARAAAGVNADTDTR